MGKWSRWLRGVVTLGVFLIGCSVVWAEEPSSQSNPGQEQLVDEMQRLEIESRMLSFYDQMHALSTDISHSAPDKLTEANQQVTTAGIAARQSRNNLFCIMTLKFQRLHFLCL